jgi:nitroreductase
VGADQHERLSSPHFVSADEGKQRAIASRARSCQRAEDYDKLPKPMPHNPNAGCFFENSPQLAEATARRNATLQGAYFMLAVRALGLDCGPMSGFDNARVDQEFFGAGLEREGVCQEYSPGRLISNFLCNLGYGDPAGLAPAFAAAGFRRSLHAAVKAALICPPYARPIASLDSAHPLHSGRITGHSEGGAT